MNHHTSANTTTAASTATTTAASISHSEGVVVVSNGSDSNVVASAEASSSSSNYPFVDPNQATTDQINFYVNMLSSLLHSFRCGQVVAEARQRGLDLTHTCRMVQCTKSANILHHIVACDKDVCTPICSYAKSITKHFQNCPNPAECPLCGRVIETDPMMEWKAPMTREFRAIVVSALVTKLGVDDDTAEFQPAVHSYFELLESRLFEQSLSQEHYFCLLFDKFNSIKEKLVRMRVMSPESDFGTNRRRLPYDPDASAGEHGPPNMIAPICSAQQSIPANRSSERVSEESDDDDDDDDDEPNTNNDDQQPQPPPPAPESTSPFSAADNRVQLDPDQLRQNLLGLLDRVSANENAGPFLQPVDPVLLCIPDYFDVIKNPMDLETIRQKAYNNEYRLDPWRFVNDIYLMFDNAILYNKKQTKVHKMCIRLRECYEAAVAEYASELGLCCGLKPHFSPQTIYCYGGKANCNSIKPQQIYYCYTNDLPQPNLKGNLYGVCLKCFDADKSDDSVRVGDNVNEPLVSVKKSSFVQKRNTKLEEEPVVTCSQCHRKYHQICELYYENMEKRTKFVCSFCRRRLGMPSRLNRFTAAKLPHYAMSRHIEEDLNRLLREKSLQSLVGKVHVRVLCSYDKVFEVKEKTRIYYEDDAPKDGFPYRAKAIFVFEEIDGVDVAFFAMHVHEYGSDCPHPNRNRVYISYLDSVHYFQPYKLKTDVYHQVIISYMSFAKSRGFEFAHIWACPPNRGDDYIFYYHPKGQKVPEQRRLANWYRAMLDRAKREGVVVELRDVISDMVIRKGSKSLDIPYFEGDFFSAAIEDELHNLFQKFGRQTVNSKPVSGPNDDEEGLKKRKGLGSKGGKQNAKKVFKHFECKDEVTEKVANLMEKHKDVFFIMKLNDEPRESVRDPDPLMYCDMMSGRDCFLNFCRDRNFEYSTLRRSKYTTMAFLYELHTQGVSDNDEFCYTCDLCSCSLGNRYHCTKCDDFDLCAGCYESKGHEHEMQLINVAARLLAIESSDQEAKETKPKAIDSQELKQRLIQSYVDSMHHAIECRNANCRLAICRSMKSSLDHVHLCANNNYPNVPRGDCQLCHKLYALACTHAKNCREVDCAFPFCPLVKSVIQQQRNKSEQMDQRRMLMMMDRMAPQTPGNASASFASPDNEKEDDEQLSPVTPGSGTNVQIQLQQHQQHQQIQHQSAAPTAIGGIPRGGKDWRQIHHQQNQHLRQQQQQYYVQSSGYRQAMWMQQQQQMQYIPQSYHHRQQPTAYQMQQPRQMPPPLQQPYGTVVMTPRYPTQNYGTNYPPQPQLIDPCRYAPQPTPLPLNPSVDQQQQQRTNNMTNPPQQQQYRPQPPSGF